MSLTNVLGRHSLKVGFEYAAINTEVQDTNPLYGLDTYSSQFSRPAGAAANNQYNLADFYFGARTQYELASLIVAQMRQRGTYAYVQDDITRQLDADGQPRPALRVRDAVLRSREPAVELRSGDQHLIVAAADGSIADRALVDPDRNNFAPRFGFAWQPLKDTVVRGGYGIGYIHFNRLASAGLLATNYPVVTRATVTQALTRGADGRVILCTGDQFAGCFRTTQQGYAPNLPNNVMLYIPPDTPSGYIQSWHVSVQQQAHGQHRRRPRLRRQPRRQPVDARRHQPGAAAASPARTRTRRWRRAGRFRATARSRRCCRRRSRTTTPCRPRSSTAVDAA